MSDLRDTTLLKEAAHALYDGAALDPAWCAAHGVDETERRRLLRALGAIVVGYARAPTTIRRQLMSCAASDVLQWEPAAGRVAREVATAVSVFAGAVGINDEPEKD